MAFTRNPANGVKEFYGEFLINAQGEDVVAGVRTPEPVAELKKQMPKAYNELERIRQTLEKHFKDVQDFEFTIQDGVVYMLQTRNGKRTAMAALKFSMDMVKEKLIDWETAVMRNPADQLDQLLAPVFDAAEVAKAAPIATGLPAGPGAASGQIYLNADRAVAAAEKGEKVLLVRVETSPEDLRGMIAAEGILTARGGVSSHAALVARQMGKVCVCGAAARRGGLRRPTRHAWTARRSRKATGCRSTAPPARSTPARSRRRRPRSSRASIERRRGRQDDREVQELPAAHEVVRAGHAHGGAHQRRHAGADAERRGLRRRGHRPEPHRAHVLRGRPHRRDARDDPRRDARGPRKAALAKLLPYQRDDFAGIFQALKGYPATIRFLDPPLHEFLPHTQGAAGRPGEEAGRAGRADHARASSELHEFNPMLGFRGCRLGISYPGDLRDAGPRGVRGRGDRAEGGHQGASPRS